MAGRRKGKGTCGVLQKDIVIIMVIIINSAFFSDQQVVVEDIELLPDISTIEIHRTMLGTPPAYGYSYGDYGCNNRGYGFAGPTCPTSPHPPIPSPSLDHSPSPNPSQSLPPTHQSPDSGSVNICDNHMNDTICKASLPTLSAVLLVAGGVANCQGTFTGVLSNKSSPIKTTSAGNFSVDSNVKLALYNFTNDGICKDLLSDAPVWFATSQYLPPVSPAVISPLSTLTTPAAVGQLPGSLQLALSPRWSLLDKVYRKFGFDADTLKINVLTWQGLSFNRTVLAAVLGTNMQVAALYGLATNLLGPLLASKASADAHRSGLQLSSELANQLWLQAEATGAVDAHAVLSDINALQSILEDTFAALTSSGNVVPARALLSSFPEVQRKLLFSKVAQVLAQSNLVLQGYIDDALNNDTYGADQNYTLATAAVLGSYAQVQQKMIAVDVFNLTNYFLTHPENNITSNLTVFQEAYMVDSFSKLARVASISQRMVVNSLEFLSGANGVKPVVGNSSDPWDDLVVAVARKPKLGLLGLLGMLGLMGLIGVIPATSVAATAASFAAMGIIFLTPGMILAPSGTSLPAVLNPNQVKPWPFNATCSGLTPLGLNISNPGVPLDARSQIPSFLCLPAGDLYDVKRLPEVAVPKIWSLPNGTVFIPPTTVVIPPNGTNTTIPDMPNGTAWFQTNQTVPADAVPGGITTNTSQDGSPIVVVPAQHSTDGHGASPLISVGPPKDACGNLLQPIAPMTKSNNWRAKARPSVPQMFGAMYGMGFLSSCAGDYYFYSNIANDDPNRALLNMDRAFGIQYKDYITGPSYALTNGRFAVDNVTGPGHAIGTGAWASSPDLPAYQVSCYDSLTQINVKVPVGGLTPYPTDVVSQPIFAPQVIITPTALKTLGRYHTGADLADAYDLAYGDMGVYIQGGMYGKGVINSDPLLMLASGNTAQVKTAVTLLAANAQVLGILSVARALSECQGVSLSNELFVQWSQVLLNTSTLGNVSELMTQLDAVCLSKSSCTLGAAKAFVAINLQLERIKAQYSRWPDSAAVPALLYQDVLTVVQSARVAQVDLPAAVEDCCKSGASQIFASYQTGLQNLLDAADVNRTLLINAASQSASASGSGSVDDGSSAVLAMQGKVLNAGYVKHCTGQYKELLTGSSQRLATDNAGQFVVTTPATALYNFSSSKDLSACKDGVTGINLAFPWTLAMPARAQATITAIALLTVPAASDADVHHAYADTITNKDAFVPGYLWDHVYGMYGYDGTKMGVDFLKFTSVSMNPHWVVALIGHNVQTYSAFTSAANLLAGLYGDSWHSQDQIAQQIVNATYHVMKHNHPRNASVALRTSNMLAAVYQQAYEAAMPQNSRRSLLQTTVPAHKLSAVFQSVADTVASVNKVLESLVQQAQIYATAPTAKGTADAMALLTSISKLAAVQQDDLASSITALSQEVLRGFASDSVGYDPSSALAAFKQNYSTDALQQKMAAKTVDTEAVAGTLHGTMARTLAPLPDHVESTYMGWVAGVVIGGFVGVLLVTYAVFAAWQRHKQRLLGEAESGNISETAAHQLGKISADDFHDAVSQSGTPRLAPIEGPDGVTPRSAAGDAGFAVPRRTADLRNSQGL